MLGRIVKESEKTWADSHAYKIYPDSLGHFVRYAICIMMHKFLKLLI